MATIRFEPYSTYMIIGSTGSGKTRLVQKILGFTAEMFKEPIPVSIMYCFGVHQELYDQMEKELTGVISFHQGLPSREEIEIFSSDGLHKIIVLDDLISEVTKSQTMQDLFCQYCHHKHLSVFF